MKGTITPRVCDSCLQQASYSERPLFPTQRTDDVCEECARSRGAAANGEACAAFKALGFAVSVARNAHVTDDQLRRAFEEILTEPHSEGDYPVGGDSVLGRDFRMDRPWMRIFTEISA